jgi:hypothetical protein
MNEKPVTDIPPDQYELYATFGMIAEKAQVLELEAGNVALFFLAIFLVDKDKSKITPEQTEMFRAIVDDVNKKTFGALLKRLKKMMNFDDSIITKIDEALDRRNYLTHHFFRNHNFALFSEEGRKVMMEELIEIGKKLDLAQQMLGAISSILLQIGGWDSLDKEMALHLQARGKNVDI